MHPGRATGRHRRLIVDVLIERARGKEKIVVPVNVSRVKWEQRVKFVNRDENVKSRRH